ncbi:MAG: hypothetical protein WBI55_05350 [Eubacteriales bacterium]
MRNFRCNRHNAHQRLWYNECSPLVSANRDFCNDYHTVGVPLPCVKIGIDNPNENGEGEITVSGDVVMMGYYKNPEATAEVLRDGAFYTGDYGRIGEDGRLTITGRKKNLIVLKNGKNVYPEEIEGYLNSYHIFAKLSFTRLKTRMVTKRVFAPKCSLMSN